MNERIVVAALGDSITAGTPYWDPNPAVREQIGADLDEQHQWPYWVVASDRRFELRNFGVNLERTDEIRARLASAVDGADVLVVQGGINDVVQGRDPAATLDDLRAMVRGGRREGLSVAVTDILPWNNGYPEHASAIGSLNDAIHQMASEESATVLHFYDAIEDPDRPGRMKEEWTTDGNHPSVEGHRRLAAAFVLP